MAEVLSDAQSAEVDEIVIEAGRTEGQYWRDLWRFRELFYFLAWRDLLVRYKQTVMGVAWAFIRPFLTMVIFTLLFGKLAKLPSEGVPYALLVYVGILPWQLFANGISECSYSLIKNSSMISKVYFPRLIAPFSGMLTSFVDFLISGVTLLALLVWFRFVPDGRIIALPLFTLLALLASLGFGLWFAALNVKYRDFQHIVPFVVQIGVYISPVGFASGVIPEQWRLLYFLNPMVLVIDGFRWAVLGVGQPFPLPEAFVSLAVIAGALISGVWYFRRTERTFADVI
jgi:lipopolysaccharide transport system permease protein